MAAARQHRCRHPAIRDNEDAAASVGVRVTGTKRLLFVLAAFGIGIAGALWLATAMTFQPKTYFSVQWTAYMIFMVLVGGIGTFEGAILGALLFFLIETWFGGTGVWYLVGLGATALVFSLLLPRGLWGTHRGALRAPPAAGRLPRGASRLGTRLDGRTASPAHITTLGRRHDHAFRQDDSHHRCRLRASARARPNSPASSGADVIGVDVREPARQYGTLRQGGHLVKGRRRRPGRAAAAAASMRSAMSLASPAKRAPCRRSPSTSTGLRALSEAMAPRLREGGAIVNVASIAGFGWRANLNRAASMVGIEGFPDVAKVVADHEVKNEEGYPVSKELLLLWTFRAAHQDLFKSRGIRVNAVSPGPVETPILKQFREVLGDARVDSDIARVGRAGTSGDIAPVVLFLCSDGARWINGANVPVDGGLEASINAEVLGF